MTAAREVVLYGRPGCSLCTQARAMLGRMEFELGFSTVEVNIESDEALLRRFMFEIPVVCVGDTVVARAPVYGAALREALEHEFLPG